MRFKAIPLFAFLFILIMGLGFAQVSTDFVSYEREDRAVISDAYGTLAHVELDNSYTKVGSEMYLQDCGLTTCYLTLTITPDAPLDARTIIGRQIGAATYVGAQIYETRSVPVATYKTIRKNYTQTSNITGKNETVFYNETVLDRYVNASVADWYALDYASMDARKTYAVRLEYYKEPTATADLVPEIAGKRIDGWAWWGNTTWRSYQETNITCPTCNGVYYFNLTFPVSVGGEMRFTTNASGTEAECGGLWKNINATGGKQEWIVNCTLNGTTTIRGYYNNNTGVSDLRNISKACDLGDDYPGSAYDTSKWDLFGNAPSVSGGLLRIDADEGLQSDRTFGVNKVVMFYANPAGTGGTNYIGFSESSATDYIAFLANNGVAPNGNYKARNINAGATTSEDTGVAQNSVSSIFKVARNASVNSIFYINTTKTNTISANLETGNLRASTNAGGSASTYYVEFTCVYDGLWLAGYNATFSEWIEVNGSFNSAPTLQSISLSPTIIYKNTTVYLAVNYTDENNATFTVYKGLAINGTVIDAFNTTNAAYSNATVWNTSYDVSNYTHGDKISGWAYAKDLDNETSIKNYTANITISNYVPVISNVQITNPIQNGSNATGTATFTDYENDTINCRFEWFKNGTAIWNSSQSPCINTSTLFYGNYTVGDLINFTVYANDSFGGNATPAYSATINVSPTFTWDNYTYVGTEFDTIPYNFSVNFTIPVGNTVNSVIFNLNSIDFIPSCTNISTSYYCTENGIPAPLIGTNGTSFTPYWMVNYTDGLSEVIINQSFTITVLYGIWPTAITSSAQMAGGTPAVVNVSYSNVSGTTATIGSTAWFLSTPYSGGLTCAAGLCTGTISTPIVSSPTNYQVEANLTISSPFWGSSINRPVRFETIRYWTTANSTSSSGTITNLANAYDGSFSTYAIFSADLATIYFNYSMPGIYVIRNWTVKDAGATRNIIPPSECSYPAAFRVNRSSTTFKYSCWNSTSETYSLISSVSPGSYYFYEMNITTFQNNTYVRVVPYGLTDCTTGTPIMAFSVKDEDTDAATVANYTQKFFLTVGSDIFGYQFTGQDNNWNICITPSGLNATYISQEQYSASGYGIRGYVIASPISTLILSNYTRYLGAGSTDYTFIVKDNFGLEISNASAIMYKFNFITSSYEEVGSGLTDYTGIVVFYMKPLDAYRFQFSKSGYETLEFDLVPSGLTEINVVLNTAGTATLQLPNFYYKWNDISYYITPTSSVGTNATNLTFGVVSNNSKIEYYGMEIKKVVNGTTSTVFSQQINASPTGGILQYEANDSAQYFIDVYFKHADYPEYSPLTKTYTITSSSGFLKVREKFQTNPPISGWTFYFIGVICAMIAGGYAARFTRIGAGVISILILGGFTFMWPDAQLVCMGGMGGTCITATHATILAFVGVLAAIFISNNQYG